MAALVGHFEPIVLRKLLAGFHFEGDAVAARVKLAGGALVESECSVDQLAAILGEPFSAIERARGFLAASQRQFERAPRLIVLCLIANQRVDPDGSLGLVIHRAARVERTIFLDQFEWVAGPVLALRFHDVNMRKQQNGLQVRFAARENGDKSAFLRVIGRGEDMQVALGKARSLEARSHALGGERAVARR
jgi:hypothetical protein